MKHQYGMEMSFPEVCVGKDQEWRHQRKFGVPGEQPHTAPKADLPVLHNEKEALIIAKKSRQMGRGRCSNLGGFSSCEDEWAPQE